MANSSMVSGERTVIRQVADSLDLYMPPILITIGVTCNTFVILVMRTSYFCKTSTSLYMTFNAVVDNIPLMVLLPTHWISVNFPDLIYRGEFLNYACKLFNFVGSSTSNIGVVLTAAMTFERAIAIKFPLKAPSLCTKRKAKLVSLGIVVFVCFKDLHYLILSKMVSEEIQQKLCEVEISNAFVEEYVGYVWPITQNIMLFASFLAIMLCNFVIIKSVRGAGNVSVRTNATPGRARETINGTSGETHNTRATRASRSKQITVMLMLDSLTIIICTLPITLLDIVRVDHGNEENAHLTFSVVFYLLYMNRCANFFLYCLSGSRFRLAMKTLCCGETRGDNRSTSVYVLSGTPNDTLEQ